MPMKRELLNSTIYSVFVRNYGKKGTFDDVRADLPRISGLGADILWLMPVHPIGKHARKGELGSPYAISDYRGINPEYGTLEDFRALADAIHAHGMKLMIDVVYNHTSPDSVLYAEHPEWFYTKKNGKPGNRIGDWSDIIDLDFDNPELREYLIDTLKYWLEQGVDGFRCDVAPLIPLDFWIDARRACDEFKKDVVWLTESVEPHFIEELRGRGFICHSDAEMYGAFDIAYDYDTYFAIHRYAAGEMSLEQYMDLKRIQIYSMPGHAIKLRHIENHDTPRGAWFFPEAKALRNYTAFTFFERGCALLYNGQEAGENNRTSLFDADPVNWERLPSHADFIKSCVSMHRAEIMRDGWYELPEGPVKGVVIAAYREIDDTESKQWKRVGVFNIEGKQGALDLSAYLPGLSKLSGNYKNLLDYDGAESGITVKDGVTVLPAEPVIFDL